jgi:hypothetical protein
MTSGSLGEEQLKPAACVDSIRNHKKPNHRAPPPPGSSLRQVWQIRAATFTSTARRPPPHDRPPTPRTPRSPTADSQRSDNLQTIPFLMQTPVAPPQGSSCILFFVVARKTRPSAYTSSNAIVWKCETSTVNIGQPCKAPTVTIGT